MEKEKFDNDDVLKNIVRKGGLEQPSFNFTEKIMGKILVSYSPEVFVYKPVISKNAWIISSVVLIGICLVVLFMPQAQTSAGNVFVKYLTPPQNVLNNVSAGFFDKLSVLNSVSWMAVVIAAGWLLFAADKFFRRLAVAA